MTLVVAILKQKSVTARTWVAVLGLVVYVSLYARPALSFLEAVFHEADGYAPGAVFVPGRRALAELSAWVAFVPFMSVDLRAKYDRRVFATDASSRSCAAVFTQMPEDLVREIWRHRPRRGIGQAYDDAAVAAEEPVSAESDGASSAADSVPQGGRWAAELCSAVGWEPLFRYSARRSEHIVTKEARPICTLVRRLAAEVRAGGARVLNFVDSSPNVGAWAKGRSSSWRLGPRLRPVAPDQLLTDLQLAIPWVPTKHNPADAPTRGRAVRRVPHRRSELADALLRCAFDDQTDAIFESSMHDVVSLSELLEPVTGPPYVVHRYTRPGLRRGDEDSLIGDGPPKGGARVRARSLTRARRAALGTDLSKGNVGEISLQLRNEARADFGDFLLSSGAGCSYDAFLQWIDSDLAAKELVRYGQQVYDDGDTVAKFKHAIIVVSRDKRSWRPALDHAWEAVRKWEALEPSTPHVPCPLIVWKAMLSVAARWRWDGVAVGLIKQFAGGMRPGESLSVRRGAISLPSRWRDLVVVAIWKHKSVTRGRAKGAHHVVIDDPLLVDVVEAHVLRLGDDDCVVGLKPHAFRRKFDAIIAELGLESLGLTPASLRAGGATERYLQREPIADISWLLRHADLNTTRHYIQSAAAMLALARIPAAAADEVERRAKAAARDLRAIVQSAPPPRVVVKLTRSRSVPV